MCIIRMTIYRKREEEAKKRVLNNPVKMKQLQDVSHILIH